MNCNDLPVTQGFVFSEHVVSVFGQIDVDVRLICDQNILVRSLVHMCVFVCDGTCAQGRRIDS